MDHLFLAETLHVEELGDHHLFYAPDFPGLPVLVSSAGRDLLETFRGGADVETVLSANPRFDRAAQVVDALCARGMLRDARAVRPYTVSPQRAAPRDLCVWLHITNACNLTCSYCFVGEKTKSLMAPGTMEEIAHAIAHTAQRYGMKNVYIKFAGGEPSTNPAGMRRFRDILDGIAGEAGVAANYEMLCNGTVLNPPLLEFLKDAAVSVSVSLDGYGAAHDIHRVFASGKGSWDLIAQNIDWLLAEGVDVNILATISQETCSSLPQLAQWVTQRGLAVRFQVVRNAGSNWCGGDRRAEYDDMNMAMAAAFDEMFDLLEAPEIHLDLRFALAICELQFDYPSSGVTCGIGANMIVVRPDGNLASCPMTVNEMSVPRTDDLVLSAARTFAPSPHNRSREGGGEDCRSCRWFKVCGGGCPVANERINGHAFSRSPLCSFYQSVIPRFVRFFGIKLLQARALGLEGDQGGPEHIVPDQVYGYRQAFFT